MSDLGADSQSTTRFDSSAQGGEGERHSIQTYVSDMLALEQHIAQPLGRQLDMDDVSKFPQAKTVIAQAKSLADAHATALKALLQQVGGHEASGVKSAWSSLLGAGAAAIDSVRKTKVSKSLRDDYTALNLATISYTMLHATAVGLGDAATSNLAKRHLADYARLVMSITQVMPAVVLEELRADGESVATGAADAIRRDTNDIWKSEAAVTHN